MKKLSIVAAIVCLAAMVQAASVDWSLGFPGFSMDGETAGAVYLMSGNTPVTGPIDAPTMVGNALASSPLTVFSGSGFVPIVQTYTDASVVQGVAANYWLLIFNGDQSLYKTGAAKSITGYDGIDIPQQGTWLSGDITPVWENVPEPTSMALLALGIAALGLRRRR